MESLGNDLVKIRSDLKIPTKDLQYKITAKNICVIVRNTRLIIHLSNAADLLNNSFVVEIIGKQDKWVDDLNIKSVEQKMSFIQFATTLLAELTKSTEIYSNDKVIYDINYFKIKAQLDSYIDSSISTTEQPSKNTYIARIFDPRSIAKRINAEYMEVWKRFKNTIDLSIVDRNVYKWSIKFSNFNNPQLVESLAQLNRLYNYNYIELTIAFNGTYYPNCPPIINVVRPRLYNNLSYKIPSMKMLQLEYWNPTRRAEVIINKLFDILDRHAVVDVDNDLNDYTKYCNSSCYTLESILVSLSSYVDVKEDNLDPEAPSYKKSVSAAASSTKKYGDNGIGYGQGSSHNWDLDTYIQLQEKRDASINMLLEKIVHEFEKGDAQMLSKVLNESILIYFIKLQLHGVTIMEIEKHSATYKLIFTILQNLANEMLIGVVDEELYKRIEEMYTNIVSIVAQITKESKNKSVTDEQIAMIENVYTMIKAAYLTTRSATSGATSGVTSGATIGATYVATMEKYKFSINDIKSNNTPLTPKTQKRIVNELSILQQSLVIDENASIFCCVSNTDISHLQFAITGPSDTPYEGGVFVFDMFLHSGFPTSPPVVTFLNTGNKRMNPNLYAEGKVCLSILGTWQGHEGEVWNEKTSTLLQVVMSIMSQILIDQPYFNEPGHARSYGTKNGEDANKAYNNHVRYFVLCHAVNDLLTKPNTYPVFKDMIVNHFRLRKEKLLQTYKKWADEAPVTASSTGYFQDSSSGGKLYTKAEYEKIIEQIADKLASDS